MTETVDGAIGRVARALRGAGIDDARLEGRILVEAIVGKVRGDRDRTLGPDDVRRLEGLVERRLRREPIALILGEREFWSLTFRVTPDTLVPRTDSETLVQAALDWGRRCPGPATVLDLGTGTGCLLLAVLSERPDDRGVGVDVSPAALDVARDNATRLGLSGRARFVDGDWGTGLAETFDLVLANPPYVADDEFATLMPDVGRYEPRLALAGGPDGLEPYRRIAGDAKRLVSPRGALVVELSPDRAEATAAIFEAAGFSLHGYANDLAGLRRCATFAP